MLSGVKLFERKYLVIVFLVIFIAIAVFVAVANIKEYQHALSMQIEDNNGAEKTLCVITNEMIESVDHQHYSIKHSVYNEGLNSSNVKGKYEKFDNSYSKIKSKMLSGIYMCNAYLGKGHPVTFTVQSRVNSGNCRLVITDSNMKIVREIPIDQEVEVSFLAPEDEIFFVKCIGESANLEIEITRKDTFD